MCIHCGCTHTHIHTHHTPHTTHAYTWTETHMVQGNILCPLFSVYFMNSGTKGLSISSISILRALCSLDELFLIIVPFSSPASKLPEMYKTRIHTISIEVNS